MMSGHDANQIFFNKKRKIGRPDHLLTSHFCFTLPPRPTQNGPYICIPPYLPQDFL